MSEQPEKCIKCGSPRTVDQKAACCDGNPHEWEQSSAEQWLASKGLADLSLNWPIGKPIPNIDYESGKTKPTLPQLMDDFAARKLAEVIALGKNCVVAITGDLEDPNIDLEHALLAIKEVFRLGIERNGLCNQQVAEIERLRQDFEKDRNADDRDWNIIKEESGAKDDARESIVKRIRELVTTEKECDEVLACLRKLSNRRYWTTHDLECACLMCGAYDVYKRNVGQDAEALLARKSPTA